MWKSDDRALRVQVGASTVPGRGRHVNQDTVIVAPGVFGVADGVGGTGSGEVASAIAAAEVAQAVAVGRDGIEAATAAHDAIRERTEREPRLRGMGTTLCFGIAGWSDDAPAVQVTNVGDSRAYLLTPAGDWRQVTRDQSHVQDLVDRGVISSAEAATHPRRNVITSSVGQNLFRPESQVVDADAVPNTRFVFCSDGVSDEIDDATLRDLIRDRDHPQAVADRVIEAVRSTGVRDDATIVVVDLLAVPRALRAPTQ